MFSQNVDCIEHKFCMNKQVSSTSSGALKTSVFVSMSTTSRHNHTWVPNGMNIKLFFFYQITT